jgi:hypothetical protein
MDFWSRLLSPLSSGTTRKDQAKDPAKRLHRFEKEYGNLLSTWRTSSNLSRDSEAAETLEVRLQELTNILSDESRRPLPHPCIQYASIKQIYVPIGKIATISYNEWIIKEAVLFFATLIESEEEAFVENPTFSASLTNLLVRITGVNSVRLGLDTESRVVELAFNITTKIRLEPHILPAWFKTQPAAPRHQGQDDKPLDSREKFAGRTQRADFPLFYILMDYIHHEGKVGDFARTGLLYIIEAASRSALLEQWIVESDLATLMATGLGALYSQLSRKLVIDHPPHSLPPILALSDYEHPLSNYEITSSCSPEFQSHLDTFLSHLLFWQDVLNHCRSLEVKSTLLEHFQIIFLEQLLYPSLLESSDIDGGSSVAVLTYLRRILESLDHPDMINLILHYLLALPDTTPTLDNGARTLVSDARKRKSMDLATMMAQKSDTTATPLLFNLVDLILACLRSRNQQTINVTLQLVSAIVKRHHRYAVLTLLRTEILPSKTVSRTIGAHEQEIDYLMHLAGSLGGLASFDEIYQGVLRDTMTRIESHPCSLKLTAPSFSNTAVTDEPPIPGAPRAVRDHSLRPDDPLLNAILDLLTTFFMNPVETNLSVSETLIDLAICGYMGVEGWLARDPRDYSYDEDDDELENTATSPFSEDTFIPTDIDPEAREEAERRKAVEKCKRRPRWKQDSVPRIFEVLDQLSQQVDAYRQTVPRFDELVQQRREAFQAADSIMDNPLPARKPTPAQVETPQRHSADVASRSTSPSRPSAFEGFAQRLFSELGTPNRTSSPRGRKEQSRSSGAASPMMSPSSAPPLPKALPLAMRDATPPGGDPGRRGSNQSLSPSGTRAEPSERDRAVDSQIAAFAAIDQTILAKRVGPPSNNKVEPIPLKFNKEPIAEPEETSKAAGEDEDDAPPISTDEGAAAEAQTAEASQAARPAEPTEPTASVSHIITNVIVYQSFLLELTSLLQVRAGLFEELRFV